MRGLPAGRLPEPSNHGRGWASPPVLSARSPVATRWQQGLAQGPEPRPGRAAPGPAPDPGTPSGRAEKDPGATQRPSPCSSRGCSGTSIRGALQWGESGRIAPAMHPKAWPKACDVHFCWRSESAPGVGAETQPRVSAQLWWRQSCLKQAIQQPGAF